MNPSYPPSQQGVPAFGPGPVAPNPSMPSEFEQTIPVPVPAAENMQHVAASPEPKAYPYEDEVAATASVTYTVNILPVQQPPHPSAGQPGYAPGQGGSYRVDPGFAQPAGPSAGPTPNHPGMPYPLGPARDPYTGEELSDRNRAIAGTLSFLAGGFGAGRFYLGYNTLGAVQLALLVVGWMTVLAGVGLLILFGLGLWTFIDAVLMWSGQVRDVHGRKLR